MILKLNMKVKWLIQEKIPAKVAAQNGTQDFLSQTKPFLHCILLCTCKGDLREVMKLHTGGQKQWLNCQWHPLKLGMKSTRKLKM